MSVRVKGRIIHFYAVCTICALYTNYLPHFSDARCFIKDVVSSCFQVILFEDANVLANMLQEKIQI